VIPKSAARSDWKLPLFGAFAAIAAHLPGMISGNGLAPFFLTAILLIISAVIMLIVAAVNGRRKLLASLAMLVVFCLAAWLLFKLSYDVYATGRWLTHAQQYKAEVMAQPEPPNPELRHIEWDGWGMAGSDTIVYLVFVPSSRLIPVSGTRSKRFIGIPCPVWRVRRLEPHWYYVVFYTDTDWTECGSESP
jgi:hypothetical protein